MSSRSSSPPWSPLRSRRARVMVDEIARITPALLSVLCDLGVAGNFPACLGPGYFGQPRIIVRFMRFIGADIRRAQISA